MSLYSNVITNNSNCEVTIQFRSWFANWVIEEPSTVIVFVKYFDIARHDVQISHSMDVLSLLFTFGKGFVFWKLINIGENLLFLLLKQVF